MKTTVAVVSLGVLAVVGGVGFDALGAASRIAEDSVADSTTQTTIKLNGKAIVVKGKGAQVNGTRIRITAAGTYQISGKLDDGQVIVETNEPQRVVLVLNNATISSATSAAIEIRKAEKVEIKLAAGSTNQLSDAARNASDNADQVDAALYSKEDLTISGSGSLLVSGNFRHGVVSKDSLKISGGNLTVNAVNDGIKGKDALRISGGIVNVTAGSDGLQSYNDSDAQKGLVVIDGGTLNIKAGKDGVQAITSVNISGGATTIVAGGGSVKATRSDEWQDRGRRYPVATSNDAPSTKGVKAGVTINIKDGTLNIDAADDALNANDTISVDGGTLRLAAGGDAIHADKQVQINGGATQIVQSYEGLESAAIYINGGSVRLIASDDGINIVSGGQNYGFFGRPGNGGGTAGSASLVIRGGYVYVDAGGDGVDANASIEMTGGTVLVNGPTANMNGPLDYDGGFKITGGLLVAAGSAGMAQAPDTSSSQYSVRVILTATQPAGTPVQITTESGKPILSFVPTKSYQSLVLSSSALTQGATYVVYTGGKFSGTAVDGLYSGTGFAAGTEVARFTMNSMVTGAGSGGGWGGMGGWGGRGSMSR